DDITFEFEKILDENDEDRDDCLLLIYRMKCVNAVGKQILRPIYRTKIPIPEKLRIRAERQRYAMNTPVMALPAADKPATATPSQPPRPRLKRPVRPTQN